MLPDAARDSQILPDAPRDSQILLDAPRCCQRLPETPDASKTRPSKKIIQQIIRCMCAPLNMRIEFLSGLNLILTHYSLWNMQIKET